jgi:hypothetical protein
MIDAGTNDQPLLSAHSAVAATLPVVGWIWGWLFLLIPAGLLVRRLTGEFSTPLAPEVVALVASFAAAAALGLRWFSRIAFSTGRSATKHAAILWLTRLGWLLLVAAIWLPGTSVWGAAALLIAIGAEESLGRYGKLRGSLFANRADLSVAAARKAPRNLSRAKPAAGPLERHVLQQLTQGRSAHGDLFWQGIVRATFLPDQRLAAAHVAFCPPFARLPEVQAWHLVGPAAEVQVKQVLAHGARLDIKFKNEATRSCEVLLEFSAQERPTTGERT